MENAGSLSPTALGGEITAQTFFSWNHRHDGARCHTVEFPDHESPELAPLRALVRSLKLNESTRQFNLAAGSRALAMAFFLAGSFRSEWLWRSFRRRFPVCPWQHRFCRCRRAPELPRVGFHGAIESIHGSAGRDCSINNQPRRWRAGPDPIGLRGSAMLLHGEIHAAFGSYTPPSAK